MAALSHRATIDQLTFDLKFISHVKSSRPFGKIATDDVRAVKDLLLAGTQAHAACAFPHGDLVLTVTGAPPLAFSASGAVENHEPSEPFVFEVLGSLSWSASDGRTGTCEVDIQAVTDFAARQRTVSARVCEHTVEETLAWS